MIYAPTPDLRPLTSRLRHGISLIEVLISMFVLLFGLMGVASFFPVGSHFVKKGDRFDRVAAVGQAAANDMAVRGILRPEEWKNRLGNALFAPFSDDGGGGSLYPPGRVHTVVIDPLGMAEGLAQPIAAEIETFPPDSGTAPIRASILDLSGLPVMSKEVAELIFRSRDDVAFAIPDSGDEASNVLFEVNGTTPLRRMWTGDYSWLVTIGPAYTDTNNDGKQALSTGNYNLATNKHSLDVRHDVSIVVFYKRDLLFRTGGTTEYNEREVEVRILSPSFGGGEVLLRSSATPDELKGIRQGEWMMLYGPIPNPGGPARFFVEWYKIIAIDDEDDDSPDKRLVSLKGPDWPWTAGTDDVQAGLFQGAVAVFTRSMKLEGDSPWSLE